MRGLRRESLPCFLEIKTECDGFGRPFELTRQEMHEEGRWELRLIVRSSAVNPCLNRVELISRERSASLRHCATQHLFVEIAAGRISDADLRDRSRIRRQLITIGRTASGVAGYALRLEDVRRNPSVCSERERGGDGSKRRIAGGILSIDTIIVGGGRAKPSVRIGRHIGAHGSNL